MPNCKPGDLAIIHGLAIEPEHNGLIITAVEIAQINERGLWWFVSPPSYNPQDGLRNVYNDHNLKPIRGTGKPQAVTHHTSDKQTA